MKPPCFVCMVYHWICEFESFQVKATCLGATILWRETLGRKKADQVIAPPPPFPFFHRTLVFPLMVEILVEIFSAPVWQAFYTNFCGFLIYRKFFRVKSRGRSYDSFFKIKYQLDYNENISRQSTRRVAAKPGGFLFAMSLFVEINRTTLGSSIKRRNKA